jgi:hypothetical protein
LFRYFKCHQYLTLEFTLQSFTSKKYLL